MDQTCSSCQWWKRTDWKHAPNDWGVCEKWTQTDARFYPDADCDLGINSLALITHESFGCTQWTQQEPHP